MSLHKLLAYELNVIIEESRKDFPNVKESSERMLLLLKSIQHKDGTFAQAIKKSGEVIKPFLLCCETKNPKLIISSLSSFQLLVSHDALPDEGAIGIIVETLLRIYEQQDEVISLKIIQLCLLILTTSKFNLDLSIYAKIFNLFFILNSHKNIIINQTSLISLRQSIPVLFENKGKESLEFVKDLFLFLDNKPTRWIKIQNVSQFFVLEMIEEIVGKFHKLFKSHDEFKSIIIDKILPMVKRLPKSDEFVETLRLCQMSLSLCQFYFDILNESQILNLLNIISSVSHSNSWKKVLGIEIIRSLFQDENFVKNILTQKENLFDVLINPLRDSIQKYDLLDFKYKPNSHKRLISSLDAFQPNHEEILNLCIDSVSSLTKTISNIIELNEKETHSHSKGDILLLELTWSGVLSTLVELLEKAHHDDTIDVILNSYLSFTIMSGITHLSTPRDAFLTSLCRYTIPSNENHLMKNEKVLKVLFQIAHIIGPYLGSSWYLILHNFQKLDKFLIKQGFSKDLSDLILDTKTFKTDALLSVIKQMIKLSNDSLPNLFADIKLIQLVFIHLERLNEIFDLVSSHFISLCKSKNSDLEKFSVENLCNLIISKCEIGAKEDLELKLFETLRQIYEIDSVKKLSLQSLSIIIQKCGQNLNTNAWNQILIILQNASDGDVENITLAFKCTQYIGNDFLSLLNLSEYIKTVGCYSKQDKSDDINTNLVAIGLFMTLADYFQNLENINELWITLYSELIESTTDLRYEVRNSAIKTLTFALTSHGQKLNDEGWNLCLSQILISTLDKIQSIASSIKDDDESGLTVSLKSVKKIYVHHSRDNITKQWSETRKLAIEGISRILIENSKSIFHLKSFIEVCKELVRFLINSCQTKSQEIYQVTANVLFDLILKTENEAKMILFNHSWEIWELIASDVTDKPTIITVLNGFEQLHSHGLLKEENIKIILRICSSLMMSPIALQGISSPSKIQETILSLYSSLAKDESKLVFQSLISFFPLDQFKKLEGVALPKKFPSVELFISIQDVMVKQFHYFDSILKVLGKCMMTRYIVGDFPLWKHTIKSFREIVNNNLETKLTTENWNELCQQLEDFIFTKDINDGLFDEEEVIISNLIFTMITEMVSNDEVNLRLISILKKSTELAPKPIASESLGYLFKLISYPKIAHLVLPQVQNRCIEIFENFLRDDKRSGGLPMQRYRRQEVLNVFKELKQVEIDPSLFGEKDSPALKGKKGLVVKLFPYLCEFIACNEDNSFKLILLELFRIASEELGLIK